MMQTLQPAGTLLYGRGMLAQLRIEMEQEGVKNPVAVCIAEDQKNARKALRSLVPIRAESILLTTGDPPRDSDFLLLLGGRAIADRYRHDPRSKALIPLSDHRLSELDGPLADYLVIDSSMVSTKGSGAVGFLTRFAASISGGLAILPDDPYIPGAFTYACRTRVTSGPDSLEELPGMLVSSGVTRPMILSDKGLTSAGLTKKIEDVLKSFKPLVFDDIPPDSDTRTVARIADLYLDESCDCIVAFGGGSVLDTGKGVFLSISMPGDSLSALAGSGRIPALLTPFFAVPTTSGTGSEVTKAAVISDADQGRKVLYISPRLQPEAAVLDGSLSLGLPPFLTSITGMDALSHAVEAYTCLGKNPLSDAFAAAAVVRIRDNLIQLMDEPTDLFRRCEMALASSFAGQAFSNSMVGMVHTIGHSVGAVCHAAHGACMSVLLPHALEYNRELIAAYLADLYPILSGSPDAADLSVFQAADAFIATIRDMNQVLNEKTSGRHPVSLRDLRDAQGQPLVSEPKFEEIAALAMGDASIVYNPRELRLNDIMDVLQAAY